MKEVRGIFYFRGDELKMVNITENRRFEFMQFTGLKDSKGKEIYEGDIIKHEFGLSKKSLIGIVRYNKEFARFQVESSSDFAGLILTTTLKTEEVIGNEFENPELLKEVSNA